MTSLVWSSCTIGSTVAQERALSLQIMDITHSLGEGVYVWSAVCF